MTAAGQQKSNDKQRIDVGRQVHTCELFLWVVTLGPVRAFPSPSPLLSPSYAPSGVGRVEDGLDGEAKGRCWVFGSRMAMAALLFSAQTDNTPLAQAPSSLSRPARSTHLLSQGFKELLRSGYQKKTSLGPIFLELWLKLHHAMTLPHSAFGSTYYELGLAAT